MDQIKDPAAEELRMLAEEALAGVEDGGDPKPEKYIELVFGPEIVKLDVFVGQIKVGPCSFVVIPNIKFIGNSSNWLQCQGSGYGYKRLSRL